MVGRPTTGDALSGPIEACLARFTAENWRDRKQAIEALLHRLREEPLDSAGTDLLLSRLLDGIGDGGQVDARAACHEVLVKLGAVGIGRVVERIRAGGEGRRLFVDVLGEIGDAGQVALLVELLADAGSDENLLAAAISALGSIGGEDAIVAVTAQLASRSPMLRLHALDALRVAEARVPVELLAPLLAEPVTRKATAALLGGSGSPQALPMLLALVGDSMRGVRAAAAVALLDLDVSLRAHGGASDAVERALAGVAAPVQAHLRALIDHPDREVSSAAVILSGMAGDEAALPAVLGRMSDPLVFERAVDLVDHLGDGAQSVLLGMCDTIGPEEQVAMLRLMGSVRAAKVDPRLIAVLLEAAADPGESVAVAACDALAKVGDRSALGPLYRACARGGVAGEHAAEALADVAKRAGRHDDLELIIGGSWPQAGALARNLCRVVGRLGWSRYVPPLVSMLGSSEASVRIAAANALGGIGGEHEGVAALCFALADEDAQVRACACRSLGQIGAARSYQALLAATADVVPLVRAAAVQSLVIIDNPVSIGRLREIILDDDSPTVVVHAIAGLGRSREPQDLNLLMSLCCAGDHEVVKAAARAMTGFGVHKATAALLGLLSHARWDVRWTAAEVLAERLDRTALASLHRARELELDELVRQVIDRAIARLEEPDAGGVTG